MNEIVFETTFSYISHFMWDWEVRIPQMMVQKEPNKGHIAKTMQILTQEVRKLRQVVV